ncbi:TetR family transcriptional regulator [Sphingobium sp. TA15]|uniref:TetR-family transcriptional regulator n=2 Tax=Sphingomonadaceae TaxID=41297 RepID=D4Z932_SPHIU|nr:MULTISPECIES: TetR/AcrR family transcriptional regulator [Sphingomonadaceae]BDD68172.1 TetR family transcriptional regulator [Sphingobium sp. TA15]EQB07152.1 TetR family transcriptional regulator [Sphingobium sp. HDIP04]MBB4046949.1 AcrR family transcriptional regulator [Sphingomonas zeae]NUU49054.1 TetR/AcrR family transcriptional regulator [Sphingomonas zeae]BAI99114.1 TetR-family transcriptional regulator [Sphingobium indicum UT26S]
MVADSRAKRPSQDSRRTAILEAAAQVFFEQGYAATSIDAIIERIGGSKRNIYNEFGNKEGLFTALVSESADTALSALSVGGFEGRSLNEVLLEFGRRLLEIYMSPGLIGVYRSIMPEALRFPELAKDFFDKGPGRASDRLAEVLAEARDRGEIDLDDCHAAADHFVGMFRDNLHLRVVLGLRPPPSPAEAEAAVTSAVGIFLHGIYGIDRAGRPKGR